MGDYVPVFYYLGCLLMEHMLQLFTKFDFHYQLEERKLPLFCLFLNIIILVIILHIYKT